MADWGALAQSPDEWANAPARAVVAAIAAGTTNAREQCELAIARIEAGDGPINAVVVRDFDRARRDADFADQLVSTGARLPLLGVPMTVKEAFDVSGLPTTWGLAEAVGNIATHDATAVTRLKRAGAVILGKTNVAAGLTDWLSDNPVYGRTHNPRNLSRTSGGSSGGSAAALAAGFVPIELGSDIGGSIRIPSSFCGTWGHKPTYGLVSSHGHRYPGTDQADQPLSVSGPMARNAVDLALVLGVISDTPLRPSGEINPKRTRVLILDQHPSAPQAPVYRDALARLEERAGAAGVTILRHHKMLPDLAQQHRAYCKMLAITFARGAPAPDGKQISLSQWFELLDAQARNRRAWSALFEDVDAVVTPANVIAAFPHRNDPYHQRRLTVDGIDTSYDAQLVWAGLATYPGLPASVFPAATDPEGLPLGLQVMCDAHDDLSAIAIADHLFGVLQ